MAGAVRRGGLGWGERAPAAVVFDCDGTLADTEVLAHRVFADMLGRYGYQFTREDFQRIVGRPMQANHRYLAARADLPGLAAFEQEWYERSFDLLATDLHLFPDAVATVHGVASAGLPIAVASSSPRRHVQLVLERGGIGGLVSAVVGSEDVTRHKPDPSPYHEAAQLVGASAASCLAVEDTPVGIQAARAAGMCTLGILRPGFTREQLLAAHQVVDVLSMEALYEVWDGRAGGRGRAQHSA